MEKKPDYIIQVVLDKPFYRKLTGDQVEELKESLLSVEGVIEANLYKGIRELLLVVILSGESNSNQILSVVANPIISEMNLETRTLFPLELFSSELTS